MTLVKSTSTVSRSRLAGFGLLATILTTANVALSANLPETKQEFPRLGGIQIGRTPFEESYASAEYQAQLARLDFVILGGSGFGSSLNGQAAAIKQINPNVLLGKYFNIAEVSKNATGYFQPQREVLNTGQGPNNSNAFDWWLRTTDGKNVEIWPGTYRTNMTEYVKPNADGDRWTEWRAKYDYNVWLHADAWDFWFSDIVDWKPRFRSQGLIGDYSGGKVSNSAEIFAAYRRGHVANWNEIRRLTPDKLITGNINWFLFDNADNRLDLKEYKNQLHGGVLEQVMGKEHSVEAQRGWQTLYQYYGWSMEYFIDPRTVIFNVIGSPNDFQFFRYAFATCLMNDAFFDYSPETYFYGTVEWFDEFDLAGTADTSWLGRSVSAPPAQAWQKGVFRRDFENGIALVNPRGNGKVTVSLENGFRRISGQQDPTVNNGQAVSVVTLKDGDGIVLVREIAFVPKLPPKSPTLQVE